MHGPSATYGGVMRGHGFGAEMSKPFYCFLEIVTLFFSLGSLHFASQSFSSTSCV